MQALSLSYQRASITYWGERLGSPFFRASDVFGNSIRRNVLQRLLASVALRLRGAYLFEVDRRPVLERARP